MVVTVLMSGFAGASFLHDAYAQKFRANRDARAAAWAQGVNGCGNGSSGTDDLWRARDGEGLGEIDTSSPPSFLNVGQTSASRSAPAVAVPSLIGGGSTGALTSNQQVACNEQVYDAKRNVFSKIGDALGLLVDAF